MTLTSAWLHDGETYDGKEGRLLVDSMFQSTGVVDLNDFLVEQQTVAAATVKVQAGGIIIAATGAGLFGKYQTANDASLNSGTIAPTSGNGRKDRLIVRVTSGIPALEIVQGVAAASPAEPSITGDNYEELALITLPSSTTNITTAMITDRRARATAQGGTSPIASTSVFPATPFTGMEAYDVSTGRKYIYNGTVWVCITPVAAMVSTSQGGGGTSYTDLATVGPAVSLLTGTKALVTISCELSSNTASDGAAMSFAISGATTVAANDAYRVATLFPSVANIFMAGARQYYFNGLTPGLNTFTAKYKALVGGTATWSERLISAVGLP